VTLDAGGKTRDYRKQASQRGDPENGTQMVQIQVDAALTCPNKNPA
jgi:hypothetical protein